MIGDDLIAVAEDMLRPTIGPGRQGFLRRAVSTAYYAVFHPLAHECVAQMVGWSTRSPNYWKIIPPVYRSFDHVGAKRLFHRMANDGTQSAEFRQIGLIFVSLQDDRIAADYDPQPRLSRRYALERVQQAAQAIGLLRNLLSDERRLLVVQLVTRHR